VGSSLASMIDHDAIENWNGTKNKGSNENYNRFKLENEAEKLAKQAAEKLRKERLAVSSLTEPTWTGKNGIAPTKKRFGNTKSVLTPTLSNPVVITNNKKPEPPTLKETDKSFFGSTICGLSNSGKNAADNLSSQSLLKNIQHQKPLKKINDVDLIKNILEYLTACGGKATTQQIVEHFKHQLPPNSTMLFKKMLQQLANFHKAEGVWVIKTGFS